MNIISRVFNVYNQVIEKIQSLDFLVLLALRLYLAPIFIISGWIKFVYFEKAVNWFGNVEEGLGLPFPVLMVSLTILAELIGGIALLAGLWTRIFSFLLSITMIVAAKTVHWENGWFAVTPTDASTSISSLFAKIGFPGSQMSIENSAEARMRLDKARELLQNHGNYDWLTETGNFVILNNGIEFSVTYLLMLLVLVIYGSGRWVSVDYYLTKLVKPNLAKTKLVK